MLRDFHVAQAQDALQHCRLFSSADLDEACERISTVMQPHKLRPMAGAGRGELYMDYLHFRGLGLGAIRLGQVEVDVGEVDGYHLLICCRAGQARIRTSVGEIEINARRGVCLAPGEMFRGEFSEDCEQLVFRIDPKMLDVHAGGRRTRLNPVFALDNPRLRPWVSTVNGILGDPSAVRLIQSNDRVAAGYEQLLIDLLLGGHERVEASAEAPTTIAPGSVKRAESFIRSNFSLQIRLDDISEAAGIPTRTLLDAFRQFRGISPMRYLRDVRLDSVHGALNGNPEANVSTLAMDAGFGHLGRFAAEYQARFGETPSQTRSRLRERRTVARARPVRA